MAERRSGGCPGTINQTCWKGQRILYKGAEALIVDVQPVLIIKIREKNTIICGNAILPDVCFMAKEDLPVLSLKAG